tara:strand:- start:158 stop:373 length:216 start_codon:yes stop_codon:yes gene_type:complete
MIKKSKDMKYLTVLDFGSGRVVQYSLQNDEQWVEMNDGICPYETFMDSKGHKVSDCEWMVHDNPGVEFELE